MSFWNISEKEKEEMEKPAKDFIKDINKMSEKVEGEK